MKKGERESKKEHSARKTMKYRKKERKNFFSVLSSFFFLSKSKINPNF